MLKWYTRLRPFLLGMAGALVVALVIGAVWAWLIVWTRAYNGQLAWEYLVKAQQTQAQQAPGK